MSSRHIEERRRVESVTSQQRLMDAINGTVLKPRERQVLLLKIFDDLSHNEIADRLNITEKTSPSKGVAGAGLGLGIAGTALGLLNGGAGLLNLHSGIAGGCCSENTAVNRYELNLTQEIASKDARIGLLESQVYVDQKLTDVVKDYTAQINALQAQIAQQAVFNATINGTVTCMQGQLSAITKTVVPNTSVCPGWGNVTITPAAATTTTPAA
ncbi:RNA polymerase sigma factor [Flavonifractor sp. An9]|uniref:RNA polymerase sigma factor n=1 Tax=Flavonifractor sp. An9 TaxID=1965664 RepID=UPI0013022C15|nr:sigma-70 family RNA polymerase sigma factor [Flavonifractor sp. An9]